MSLHKLFVMILASIFVLVLSACDTTANQPSPQPEPTPEVPQEHISAREWISAVTGLDGNNILKYTCLAQRDNIQQMSAWTSALPILGSMFTGGTLEVKSDASDLRFETLAKNDTSAQVRVYGELRMAVSAVADAQQLDEQWQMVYENDTWRWCGAIKSNLSLPTVARESLVISQPTSSTTQSTNDQKENVEDQLASFIIGLWEWQDSADSYASFDFTNNGNVIINNQGSMNYEVVSENTILVSDGSHEQVLRIRDIQDNTMTFEMNGLEYTAQRLQSIPNLAETIEGLWFLSDENDNMVAGIEFAPSGVLIHPAVGMTQYRAISGNTIEINLSGRSYFLQVRNSDSKTLAIKIESDKVVSFSRIEGHSNLAERIVGLWRNDFGGESEFTSDGRMIDGEITAYEVISNNTLLLIPEGRDDVLLSVIEISDDVVLLGEWGAAYQKDYEPEQWFRVDSR